MPIAPHCTPSLNSTPMTWLAATASITLASCSVEGRRVPLQRMWRWDARLSLVQDECGCSRRRTAETSCLAGARPSHPRYRPVAAGIGRWRSAATVVLVPAILASLSLEPPAEAAVTTALSAGISPSMEATRHDGRCPLLALSGHCVRRSKCPLSRVKRTSTADAFSSALALSPIRLAFALSQNSARLKDKRTGEQQCSSREAIPIQISWRI